MHLRVQRTPPRPQPDLRIVRTDSENGAAPLADLPFAAYAVGIAVAVVLGVLVRLSFVLSYDFPLHDGGLFYDMVLDLQAHHYALPEITRYNGAGIPFAYPPAGFYLAGITADITGASLFDVFRFLPLAGSSLTIVAFFLLARNLLSSRVAIVASVAAFGFLPRAFLWMIMGGGLTRSFGLLFAMLTLWQVHLLFSRQRTVHIAPAVLFASLAALSHIEMAWFAAFSSLVLFVAFGRTKHSLLSLVAVGGGALVLTAPWWATIIARHGLLTFVDAMQAGSPSSVSPVASLLTFRFTSEPLFALIAALALLGVVACLAQRRYLLPAWLLITLMLDPRAFGTLAAVQMALLAGVAVSDVLVPLTSRAAGDGSAARPPRALPYVLVAALFAYALLSAFVASPLLLTAESPDERAALQWVADTTPTTSTFAVVTADSWFDDRTTEWFPALAERTSVATPQGYEWVQGGAFQRQLALHHALQACASKDGACIERWAADGGVSYDYVYIPKLAPRAYPSGDPHECCASLRTALRSDPRYSLVYDGAGASVFKRL